MGGGGCCWRVAGHVLMTPEAPPIIRTFFEFPALMPKPKGLGTLSETGSTLLKSKPPNLCGQNSCFMGFFFVCATDTMNKLSLDKI